MTQVYEGLENELPAVVVPAAWTDPKTGAVFVHKDLAYQPPQWDREEHIAPLKAEESFADVASWVEYVKYYTPIDHSGMLLTWNSQGLRAVLDYHEGGDEPGRCQWVARQPFALSTEWKAWSAFANGQPHAQRAAIEKLEELGEDIVEPVETDLVLLLRTLRANVSSQAETELREDGTTEVKFQKNAQVHGGHGTAVQVPGLIVIAIPVLHGDTAKWKVSIRLRMSVDDSARLGLRFSLVNADRILEAVYSERVAAAKAALGDEYSVLRAAG